VQVVLVRVGLVLLDVFGHVEEELLNLRTFSLYP